MKETKTTINGVQHLVLTWENNDTLPPCEEKFVLPEEEYDAMRWMQNKEQVPLMLLVR